MDRLSTATAAVDAAVGALGDSSPPDGRGGLSHWTEARLLLLHARSEIERAAELQRLAQRRPSQ